MKNPWLEVPLEDYEAHMALPSVGQARLLADELCAAVERLRPPSLLVLGCAGGNGLDRVPPEIVSRVVCIDINPSFIAVARSRYEDRFSHFEARVADLEAGPLDIEPVSLAYGGLVFEYVEPGRAIANVRPAIAPGGSLLTILQLPSSVPHVTPSPYDSLGVLSSCFTLREPSEFARIVGAPG